MKNKIIFGILFLAGIVLFARLDYFMSQYRWDKSHLRDLIQKREEVIRVLPEELNPEIRQRLEQLQEEEKENIDLQQVQLMSFYYSVLWVYGIVVTLIVLLLVIYRFKIGHRVAQQK
ncbi:hypothetical protein [Chryseolinea soli]|uniref:Uncharacterized protein n=1 Tax=Chryseolinea soli TaxID=2321403 RepID=A0A385SSV4_9BACT|nr:hypothetical protein [Chryseolinea soli]AYB34299.1 hypothetical protein D4L85_28625 [Chryseolinea soli]